MDETNDKLLISKRSKSQTRRNHFISKNAKLFNKAAKHKGSTGYDYHFTDSLKLKDIKSRASLHKDVFPSKKEFRSMFNDFMAPRLREEYHPDLITDKK